MEETLMEELVSKITSMIEDIQPYVEFDNESGT